MGAYIRPACGDLALQEEPALQVFHIVAELSAELEAWRPPGLGTVAVQPVWADAKIVGGFADTQQLLRYHRMNSSHHRRGGVRVRALGPEAVRA